ncbi:MAG: cation:proton antiporter [Candidatus Rokubacteria bacterium]|nr:cation:proton antiporter [Candidatus Rokubacteria bacterium]
MRQFEVARQPAVTRWSGSTASRPHARWTAVGLVLGLGLPGVAHAAAGEGHPQFGPILFGLAVLVLAAKAGGLLVERWGQPAVLGELVVGIALGNLLPLAFGAQGLAFVRSDPTLRVLAEVGVLILLFDVGLEADLRALVRVGPSSLLVALIGVVAPFGMGWLVGTWLMPTAPGLVPVFLGATLTATSVGITARVLKDLGVTQSPEAQTILGAALLDDVLGLMVLAVVGGMATAAAAGVPEVSVATVAGVLAKAVVFLGGAVALGHFFSSSLVRLVARTGHPGTLLIVGLALCFTFAFVAERIGLADIVGAFAAGLMLDPYGQGVRTRAEAASLSELLGPLSELFVPLFFVLMGIQVHLGSLASPEVLRLGSVLLVCAVLGKLASAVGVVSRGIDPLTVAIGMIPRGEVGLIFAGIGATLTLGGGPILSQGVFSAVVLMVVVTTLVTPPGLRWAFRRRARGRGEHHGARSGTGETSHHHP